MQMQAKDRDCHKTGSSTHVRLSNFVRYTKRKALPVSLILTPPVFLAVRSELKFPDLTDYGRRRSRSNLIRASGDTDIAVSKEEGLEMTRGG